MTLSSDYFSIVHRILYMHIYAYFDTTTQLFPIPKKKTIKYFTAILPNDPSNPIDTFMQIIIHTHTNTLVTICKDELKHADTELCSQRHSYD